MERTLGSGAVSIIGRAKVTGSRPVISPHNVPLKSHNDGGCEDGLAKGNPEHFTGLAGYRIRTGSMSECG